MSEIKEINIKKLVVENLTTEDVNKHIGSNYTSLYVKNSIKELDINDLKNLKFPISMIELELEKFEESVKERKRLDILTILMDRNDTERDVIKLKEKVKTL